MTTQKKRKARRIQAILASANMQNTLPTEKLTCSKLTAGFLNFDGGSREMAASNFRDGRIG